MLCKVVVTFGPVDVIVKCVFSKESNRAAVFFMVVDLYFGCQINFGFYNLNVKLAVMRVSRFNGQTKNKGTRRKKTLFQEPQAYTASSGFSWPDATL